MPSMKKPETDTNELEMLRRKACFLEALVDALPTPLFAKTADGRFCFFNKAYEAFFTIDRSAFLGKTVQDLDFLSREARERCRREDERALRDGTEIRYETAYETSEGTRYVLYRSKGFQTPCTGEKGLVGILVDVSSAKKLEIACNLKVRELEETQKKLRRLSCTDQLTELFNRRLFEERALDYMNLADRHGQPLSLLMADLDHFKRVNDQFGHDAGDAVLKTFAGILHDECRSEDIPARVGGEEFVVLLPMTAQEQARELAERIRRSLYTNCRLPDGSTITCSVGVARYFPHEKLEQFVKRADLALYRAKTEGRNRVCLYEEAPPGE